MKKKINLNELNKFEIEKAQLRKFRGGDCPQCGCTCSCTCSNEFDGNDVCNSTKGTNGGNSNKGNANPR